MDWRWPCLFFTAALLGALSRAQIVQVSARLSGAISGHRVVIDPGHGGPDPGAVGRSGLLEKDLVLEIAFHLRRALGRAGVFVRMTRETDRDFGGDDYGSMLARKRRDLIYRIALANRWRADLYLSIHANSINDPSCSGPQVFYNAGNPLARELAGSIQAAFSAHLSPGYRVAKSADYRVLRDTEMPAAVVEVGFLSHAAEEALLRTADYRRRIAEAIYQGLIHYFLLQAGRSGAVPTLAVPVARSGAPAHRPGPEP